MGNSIGYICNGKQVMNEQIMKDMLLIGIPECNIHVDRLPSNRTEYNKLKKSLREGDILYIKVIDQLGNNVSEVKKEWKELTQELNINIKVMDMPLLDTTLYKDIAGSFISDIVLQLLDFAEKIEMNYIEKSDIITNENKYAKLGRPKIDKPHNFDEIYMKWKDKKIRGVDAMKLLNLSKTKFYSLVKEHERR